MTLVSRREAAEILGYTPGSLHSIMARNPDQWPKPVTTDERGVVLYDLDELTKAAGGRTEPIECLECGKRMRALAPHLTTHGLTAIEYKTKHGLPRGTALTSSATQRMHHESAVERYESDPAVAATLAPYNDPEYLRELQKLGAEHVRASHQNPIAQKNRLPGRQYAVTQMWARRREILDGKAQAHGYQDAADAVDQTRGMTVAAAARATGLSEQTIQRWRARET